MGDDRGALVVVSHDRSFCNRIPFTDVAPVQDGKLVLEERTVCDSDWNSSDLSTQNAQSASDDVNGKVQDSSASSNDLDPQTHKKIYNAPKPIDCEKLEAMIEKAESKITEIDEQMMSVGNDVGKLVDLNEEKEKLEQTVSEYMDKWEKLDELLEKEVE